MVHPKQFCEALARAGVSFFTGVPDSLLKDLLAYIQVEIPRERHIIAANEGNAVAIAAGYYLATESVGGVYMQNSGLGNAVNPLTSLADREVYGIPALLIIGWRGEPGVKDEPQHQKQGSITPELLEALDVPYTIIAPEINEQQLKGDIMRLVQRAKKESRPVALLVRSGVFEKCDAPKRATASALTREGVIEAFIGSLPKDAIVVSTTGKISRELYEARKRRNEESGKDFLTVGSMGHASQIALGIALQKKERPVYCLDGDGATIMHLGALATIGWVAPQNFKHLVLNNLAHESVGGQPSAAEAVDLQGVAKSCGYASVASVDAEAKLQRALQALHGAQGPAFLEVKVNVESRKDLGRPEESPIENKKKFMDFLQHEQ